MKNSLLLLLVLWIGSSLLGSDFYKYTNHNPDVPENTLSAGDFVSPSGFAKPQTWWHWINGSVSKEGIEADLREMADKGYGFARIFHVNGKIKGPLVFNTPEWFETFRFATETANKYGLGIGIHNCDGWSEAGGPWITPELSMKELTWETIRVHGNGDEQLISLPELKRKQNYSKDIAILVWPAKRPAYLAMHKDVLKRVYPAADHNTVSGGYRDLTFTGVPLTGSLEKDNNAISLLFDGRCGDRVTFSHKNDDREKICGVTLEFKEPFEAAGVFTEVYWMYELPRNIFLEASDDGVNFEKVCELKFLQGDASAEFPARKARFWRLVRYQSKDPTERVLRGVVREYILSVSELELFAPGERSRAASPINNFDAKAGVVTMPGIVTETQKSFPESMTLQLDEVRNLTSQVESDGVLRWRVPDGEWVVMRVGYTTTGKTVHPASEAGRGLEVDKFEPSALKYHFDSYDRKMIEAAGPLAGTTFSIIETDSWEAGHQNWTQNFEKYFREINGYDVLRWLPVYAGECIGDVATTEKFLRDLRQTFSALVMGNFYGKFGELIRANGLKYETEPASGIFMRSPMNSYREADYPMTEVWQDAREAGVVSGVRLVHAHEVSSTASFYGKKYVTCEALTSRKGNWAESPWIMKGTLDTLLLAGPNVSVFHTYAHQPDERYPGWQMEPWGISQNRKLPWWDLSKPWFSYIARTQYMLQQGKPAARLLYFYSDEVPTSRAGMTFTGNHQFNVIEGDGVRNFLKVENGRLLSPGNMRYDLMLISPHTTLRLDTLEALGKLLREGASISIQSKPTGNPSLRGGPAADARWKELVDEIFGNGGKSIRKIGKGRLFMGYTPQEMIAELPLKEVFKCVVTSGSSKDIGWKHREHVDGTEWFWVINRDSAAPRSGVMSFKVEGKSVSIWHPETGRIEAAPVYAEKDAYTQIPFSLKPLEGVFVVFSPAPTKNAVAREVSVDGADFFKDGRLSSVSGSTGATPRVFVADNGKLGAEFFSPGKVSLRKSNGSSVQLSADGIPASREISGPYTVEFDSKWGAPAEPQRFEKLISWAESDIPGIKHYSGMAAYTKEITVGSKELAKGTRVHLDIAQVWEVAELTVNGRYVTTFWRPPYRCDITQYLKKGKNTLRIRVANTWVNRCLYDATLPESERLTWANTMETHYPAPDTIKPGSYFPWKDGPLPSGIIGPMKLIFSKTAVEK